jgi:formylglycine-generating enzyme required for sulfatase activity
MVNRYGAYAALLAMSLLCWLGIGARAVAQAPATTYVGKAIKDCDVCPNMVAIPTGSFTMGSPSSETGRSSDEGPLHIVIIGSALAMSQTPVTQGQWKAVMGNNPSLFWTCGDDCPVEYVSWYDVQEFIARLNTKTGKKYRLPSESEWEYACRAGGQQLYCGSDDILEVAWHDANSEGRSHAVGRKKPNAFGLFDMSGNVWEWVQDCYHGSYDRAPANGDAWTGSDVCPSRVLRGGSWSSTARNSRAARRAKNTPEVQSSYNGFRLARTLP